MNCKGLFDSLSLNGKASWITLKHNYLSNYAKHVLLLKI